MTMVINVSFLFLNNICYTQAGQATWPVLIILAQDKPVESVVAMMTRTDKFPGSSWACIRTGWVGIQDSLSPRFTLMIEETLY